MLTEHEPDLHDSFRQDPVQMRQILAFASANHDLIATVFGDEARLIRRVSVNAERLDSTEKTRPSNAELSGRLGNNPAAPFQG